MILPATARVATFRAAKPLGDHPSGAVIAMSEGWPASSSGPVRPLTAAERTSMIPVVISAQARSVAGSQAASPWPHT